MAIEITIKGLPKSGKTTLATVIADKLRPLGFSVKAHDGLESSEAIGRRGRNPKEALKVITEHDERILIKTVQAPKGWKI